jgi:hypothetical protein
MTQDKSKYDVKGTKTLLAIDATDLDVLNLLGERDIQGLRVVSYVWDTNTLSNVRMTQPLTSAGIADLDLATKGIFWAETRIEYSGDNPIYVGYNDTLGAATSDTDWQIKKITYTGSNPTRIQIQLTSWDLRAAGWS